MRRKPEKTIKEIEKWRTREEKKRKKHMKLSW
jgi:hypothetical protein